MRRKIKAIKEWSKPNSITEVRSIPNLASFYRRFIKDFNLIIILLMKIVKKSVEFQWRQNFNGGIEQENAFNTIKYKLCKAPM